MATVGNLLIGVDDGTPELRIILVEVTNVVQWGSPVTGLWDANVNWQPAVVPGADSDVLFPSFYGPGIDAYTVTRLTSSDPFVRSLTLEGGDVTIASATGLAEGAFAITDRMSLEGGVLRLTHPVVDGLTGGRLVSVSIPDDVTTTDARLEIHDRVRVSSGSTTVLDPGDRVLLVGSSSETPKESWGAIGSDLLLTPWGVAPPEADAGEPQLEVQGQGAIEGDLINEGWLRLAPLDAERPGEVATFESGLSIEGDYVQAEWGVLEVRLGQAGDHLGDAPPLLVKGRATIDGTLRLTRAPDYTPTPGDHFTILLAGEGIDLGDGLTASGEPTRPTIEQRGFRVIEGILDTGDPNVFWGVDYNQRRAGEHVIQVVALRVPTRVAGNTSTGHPVHTMRGIPELYSPQTIDRRSDVRHMIIVSHGTTDTIDLSGTHQLGEIAIGMHEATRQGNVERDWDVLVLDWKEFATNPNGSTTWVCLGLDSDGRVDDPVDSRNREFEPFEVARFGQQYAASVLRYLERAGRDVGALDSLHTIGHSSGSFVAEGIVDVLASQDVSPFEGRTPARTHVTILDAYLPPAHGGTIFQCLLGDVAPITRDWTGHELGILGRSGGARVADDMDHFFYRDTVVPGTNNEIEFRTANDVVAFDVTDYFRESQRFGAGHSAPVKYYRDSVYTALNEPLMVESPNGVRRREVLVEFGAVFSPLFNDLRIGRRLDEAWQQASREDLLDRDIDVVRAFRLDLLVFEMIITGFDSRGTDSDRLSDSGFRMRTNSPAMATFSTPVGGSANAVTFDILRTEGMGGRLLVSLQGEPIDLISLDDLGIGVGDRLSHAIDIDPIDAGHVAFEFVLEDTFGPVEIEIHDLAFALVDRTFDDGVPSSTPIRASGGSDGSLLATWVDPDGRPVLFSYDALANGWTEWSEGQIEFGAALDAVSIHDPKSDESFVGLASSQGVVLLDPEAPDEGIVNLTETLASTGATPIVRATTTLTSQDGLVFIAGLDEADDLVMYWQTGQVDASGMQIWAFTNLDRDHLEPQGLTRPAWRGAITS
ncbi:MAG: hypothetical protein KDA28_02600, partial [Phycisphaerales bacterium]|nr:hypothetical protein [Phycisphaerales bacterium]